MTIGSLVIATLGLIAAIEFITICGQDMEIKSLHRRLKYKQWLLGV